MKRSKKPDRIDEVREFLRGSVAVAGAQGVSYYKLAETVELKFPEVVELLQAKFLADWIKRELRILRDSAGLPVLGSFAGVLGPRPAFTWSTAALQKGTLAASCFRAQY